MLQLGADLGAGYFGYYPGGLRMDTQPGFSGLDGYPAHPRFSGGTRIPRHVMSEVVIPLREPIRELGFSLNIFFPTTLRCFPAIS